MARRRMFSNEITTAAKFLMLPPSAQLLYFHLGMAADDDGVVEAFTVMRMTGASEDDLQTLFAKGFVTILNDELVTYIRDWKVNNTLRQDRYKQSIYKDLLENVSCQPDNNQLTTKCQPNVNQMTAQARQGKNSLNQISIGKARELPPTVQEVKEYCDENGLQIDAQAFVDYYDERNWKTGEDKINDWRAIAKSWSKRQKRQYTTAAEYKPPNSKIDVSKLEELKRFSMETAGNQQNTSV